MTARDKILFKYELPVRVTVLVSLILIFFLLVSISAFITGRILIGFFPLVGIYYILSLNKFWAISLEESHFTVWKFPFSKKQIPYTDISHIQMDPDIVKLQQPLKIYFKFGKIKKVARFDFKSENILIELLTFLDKKVSSSKIKVNTMNSVLYENGSYKLLK